MKRSRRIFTSEFKQEAVRQSIDLGRTDSQVARGWTCAPSSCGPGASSSRSVA